MRTPETIGRYEIIRQLGQGGMAVVYLARDPLMDRQVALKLLPRQLTYDESMRERFRREARIVASLEHPAIVPVHDFGEFNEQPYLVMRYMDGGSLAQYTQGERQPLPEVVRILFPLSLALDKAHSQHIIHRDLKPDNILFDADENPYLSDFGIARLAEGTQTTSIMGTPAYMSPEQITGDVELDGRSDIYALGVILFEMLSGEQPYKGDTVTKVMMKHVLDPIPMILDLASDLPPMTQMVIERAMAKQREDRYGSAEELLQAVQDLLTASQAVEVGAAITGTMLQETMVELSEAEPDPLQTVIETPSFKPGADEIEREAQAAALYARLQTAIDANDWAAALAIGAELQEVSPHYRDADALIAQAEAQFMSDQKLAKHAVPFEPVKVGAEPGKKDAPSRGRKALFLGCAAGSLIILCLLVLGVFGYFAALDDAADKTAVATGSKSTVFEAAPKTEETDPAAPTPVVAAVATLAPLPTLAEPTGEAEQLSPAAILFSDTFEGKSSIGNWELWQDETAEFAIGDGELLAIGSDEETMSWVKQVDRYTDLEVTVAADILAGGSDAFFGLVFDGDGENYVGCFVQGDNSAYCGESLDGESVYGDWVIVDLSALMDNEILFVISDREWAMAVNGSCVGSGFVNFGPEGQPALAVSTADDASIASIAYEDFVVRLPSAEGLAILQCEAEYFE